ncbi:hypothetical protein H8356DRAFT_1354833 [Neocallimastix lanati (nom. inval.)]|nr:hypothetical protein H8356DRAFT_1354833 [Neocallimastix sp. JGI-2020a]
MKWYFVESIESTVAKSVNVEMIRHGFSPPDTDSIDNTNTEIITRNNGHGVIIEEWEKSLVALLSYSFPNDMDSIQVCWIKYQGWLGFRKYKRRLTRNVNTGNSVRQRSSRDQCNASEGEDHYFFQIVNSNLNPE